MDLTDAARRVVGAKQTLRAVERGEAQTVYIARDADERVVRPIREACERAGVPVVEAESMEELGRICGIAVGAAAAAVLSARGGWKGA
ncbi:MAG: ribosomal L7Ae/L30e/S12e/Gadd45 family protein [Limnochordales bacterium]|nr:ribosomal L7Ae/L30e/S12e/Gadd45 family protein [Limnochordales bacterium]